MKKPAKYYVETWDSEKDKFTAQKGVKRGPYTLFGLRVALRALRDMGYTADRYDPSIQVWSDQATFDGRMTELEMAAFRANNTMIQDDKLPPTSRGPR